MKVGIPTKKHKRFNRRDAEITERKERNEIPIVAAACRVCDTMVTRREVRFHADGIANTGALVRLLLPRAPQLAMIDGKPLSAKAYDFTAGTLRLRFPNAIDGVQVKIQR